MTGHAETSRDHVLVALVLPYTVEASSAQGYRRQFTSGCTARALATHDVPILVNHLDSPVLAWTTDPAISLWDSPEGLMLRLRPTTPLAESVVRLAAEHRFTGASVGFDRRTSTAVDVRGVRVWTAIDVNDISLTGGDGTPVFPQTWVRVMSLEASLARQGAALALPTTPPAVSPSSVHHSDWRPSMTATSKPKVLIACRWCGLVDQAQGCRHTRRPGAIVPLPSYTVSRRGNITINTTPTLTLEISARTGLPLVDRW